MNSAAINDLEQHVRLLGGFGVSDGGDEVEVAPAGQRLVALLALNPRGVRRTSVSGHLWPDASDERAAGSLRSTLWRLPAPGGAPLVEAVGQLLRLGPQMVVDVRAAAARASALCGPGECHPLTGGLEAFGGDLLPDWYDDWVLIERERFRQLRLHALEALCLRLQAAGRYAESLQAGIAAVAAEPLRESAHRRVVEVHLMEGNPGEALRQYTLYRRLLNDELGLRPSSAFVRLVFGGSAQE